MANGQAPVQPCELANEVYNGEFGHLEGVAMEDLSQEEMLNCKNSI